jgi:hypothetical protein
VNGERRAVLVLLVGNNEYRLASRERLDGGALHVYALERHRWLRLRLEERSGTRFVVHSRAKRVKAAIDGEPVYVEPPLVFEIRPRALRVRIPP